MKVYISGAITNNPNSKEQFEAAEERLKAQGYDVINPFKNQGYTYKEYIDTGLFELMHCEAIYLLKGYEQSTGATLEHDYARTVGLEIIRETDSDELTYGDLLKLFKNMFPDIFEKIIDYRPAEAKANTIHLWLMDGRELYFTYDGNTEWSLDSCERQQS